MTPIERGAGYELAHPIYLDVPMMLSFLAHLEGGFSFSETEKEMMTESQKKFVKARAGVRTKLLEPILGADAEASLDREGETGSEFEVSTERHHTAASLFNLLYAYLYQGGQIISVTDPTSLEKLYTGQLVEFSGEFVGNPLEEVLLLADRILDFMTRTEGKVAPVKTEAQRKRAGNPAAKSGPSAPTAPNDPGTEQAIEMIRAMVEDTRTSPVHDLLFKSEFGVDAVVAVASEFYAQGAGEQLREGEFRVLGKVTMVLPGEDSGDESGSGENSEEMARKINLTRRTVLGLASPRVAEEMVSAFWKGVGKEASVGDVTLSVSPPAIQILPMAIFI